MSVFVSVVFPLHAITQVLCSVISPVHTGDCDYSRQCGQVYTVALAVTVKQKFAMNE